MLNGLLESLKGIVELRDTMTREIWRLVFLEKDKRSESYYVKSNSRSKLKEICQAIGRSEYGIYWDRKELICVVEVRDQRQKEKIDLLVEQGKILLGGE